MLYEFSGISWKNAMGNLGEIPGIILRNSWGNLERISGELVEEFPGKFWSSLGIPTKT